MIISPFKSGSKNIAGETGWINYTSKTPEVMNELGSVPGYLTQLNGHISLNHPGDVQTFPNDSSPLLAWRILNSLEKPTAGFGFGPLILDVIQDPAVDDAKLLVYFSESTLAYDGRHGFAIYRTGTGDTDWGRQRFINTHGFFWNNAMSGLGKKTRLVSYHASLAENSAIRQIVRVYPSVSMLDTEASSELTGVFSHPSSFSYDVNDTKYLILQTIGAEAEWKVSLYMHGNSVMPLFPFTSNIEDPR